MTTYRITPPKGFKKTIAYKTWKRMHYRCSDRNAQCRDRYFDRGITVCERWTIGEDGKHPALCFYEDMGDRPDHKHSIDRIDNDGNYAPENCRWATYTEQANNRSGRRSSLSKKSYCILGVSRSLGEWCAIFSADVLTVNSRIRQGWDIEVALLTPYHLMPKAHKFADLLALAK